MLKLNVLKKPTEKIAIDVIENSRNSQDFVMANFDDWKARGDTEKYEDYYDECAKIYRKGGGYYDHHPELKGKSRTIREILSGNK